ncbi:phosphoenolpyruvate--protein phosphotransferase [Nocardia panacis]|uniref:Phosphocarrier protein HPr n=1 Tax=Nocardia panacis TaxID=2340916 RepID=A0A3A4KGM4_9NOCA|nr:phosphoenolpyruvate--protein phosphotransferase [Nocardia panacis]RJO80029.1 phosphoenolpyruvate--protein phosphotransferase [Nocardia panacis]
MSTIGIVVVSHSRALARAAVALAEEMRQDRAVRVEIAAGLDETTLGTDAVAVAEAIAAADSGAGVLVLMDLGSAVLSAELALDLLEQPHLVRLCAAPIVEGLVAAVVCAGGGADLAEVAAEAEQALLGKQTQLGSETAAPAPAADIAQATEQPTARTTFLVRNEHGLHARPAARLVGELRDLDAEVRLRDLTTGTGPVSGRSLSRIAALGALAGHEIEVSATGPAAQLAVDRIRDLADRWFDEGPAEHPATGETAGDAPTSTLPPRHAAGPFAASAGIGIGPVWQSAAVEFHLPDAPAGPPAVELHALETAITEVRQQIRADIARTGGGRRTAESEIFEAHLLFLDDAELLGEVTRRIAEGAPAAAAVATVFDSAAIELTRLPDEYQRARAADVRAVRDQVLAVLLGHGVEIVTRPGVLVAADLTPAQLAALNPDVVTGIVLAQGSPTAHSAILARAKGIPAVVGAGPEVLLIPEGTTVALDGSSGRLVIDPEPEIVTEFTEQAEREREKRRAAAELAQLPAITTDGVEVHVGANVASIDDAAAAVRAGADLFGLVRTEFLFLGRADAPSVTEQEQVYRELAKTLDGRRIILRTLDVGGDKPLPYVTQAPEANPFLGERGIRLALAHPDLLRDQLRAIAAVAAEYPVSVMFPMVTTVEEVRAARALLKEVAPQPLALEVGIMVEVPAAAAKAAVLAQHVDFFSIGTNDLTQYAMAVDRGNDTVATLADPLDPGVLRLIDLVCRGAGRARVAVCGEIAADPVAVPILLGLGVTELSVAAPVVPLIKARVRELDHAACAAAAVRALSCESAAEVRALVDARTSASAAAVRRSTDGCADSPR